MAVPAVTDARVRALQPRKLRYDVRDVRLVGFGVRVAPSGKKRWFVRCQHGGRRMWKVGNGRVRQRAQACPCPAPEYSLKGMFRW